MPSYSTSRIHRSPKNYSSVNDDEKGAKWWVKNFIIPLITSLMGSGGFIAIFLGIWQINPGMPTTSNPLNTLVPSSTWVASPYPTYTFYPTNTPSVSSKSSNIVSANLSIVDVETDKSVTIKARNFKANDTYNVYMNYMEYRWSEGFLVGTVNSENGAPFTIAFNIPDVLIGQRMIAILLISPTSGNFAFNWFWNNTNPSIPPTGPTATPSAIQTNAALPTETTTPIPLPTTTLTPTPVSMATPPPTLDSQYFIQKFEWLIGYRSVQIILLGVLSLALGIMVWLFRSFINVGDSDREQPIIK